MRVFLAGAAIAAYATAAAAQEPQFSRPYWLDRGVIEAIGRAQLEAPPDRASFSVHFREVARDAQEAAARAADRARLAVAAMRQRGGEGVEMRSSVSIHPIFREYRDGEGVRQSSERVDQIDNYSATVSVEVEISDVARAEVVRAAALAVGPQEAEDLRYELRESGEAQRTVHRRAVEDAAARARDSAAGAGARLGPLMALQEGRGPCLGHWYTERPGTQRSALASAQEVRRVAASDTDEEVVVSGMRGSILRITAEEMERMELPADPPRMTLSASVCAVYAVGP